MFQRDGFRISFPLLSPILLFHVYNENNLVLTIRISSIVHAKCSKTFWHQDMSVSIVERHSTLLFLQNRNRFDRFVLFRRLFDVYVVVISDVYVVVIFDEMIRRYCSTVVDFDDDDFDVDVILVNHRRNGTSVFALKKTKKKIN